MVRRKTLGQRLRAEREAQDLSLDDLVERIAKIGGNASETTIRSIEKGVTLNPGVKTIEEIALGLNLPPLEVMEWALSDPPPEKTQRYSESHFAIAAQLYESSPPGRKLIYDEILDMLIERMRKG